MRDWIVALQDLNSIVWPSDDDVPATIDERSATAKSLILIGKQK